MNPLEPRDGVREGATGCWLLAVRRPAAAVLWLLAVIHREWGKFGSLVGELRPVRDRHLLLATR